PSYSLGRNLVMASRFSYKWLSASNVVYGSSRCVTLMYSLSAMVPLPSMRRRTSRSRLEPDANPQGRWQQPAATSSATGSAGVLDRGGEHFETDSLRNRRRH